MKIHETAIIDPKAVISDSAVIGPYVRVEGDVEIGPDCEIMQAAQLLDGVRLGARVKIHQGAIIGGLAQDKKFKSGQTFCVIGDDSVIREYVTISRSTKPGGATNIGKGAYIMANAHIAHDCQVGDNVTMANLVTLAGHVQVEDLVTIGGMTVIHQFVRVGELAMVGGDSGLMLDAPPYMISFGYPPAKVFGLNTIGLKRNGIDEETRLLLKRAFRLLYRSHLNFSQAIEQIEKEMPKNKHIKHLIDFFRTSKRGLSTSSHTQTSPSFSPHNGYQTENFKNLIRVVKDEDTLKEILSYLEAKAEEIRESRA